MNNIEDKELSELLKGVEIEKDNLSEEEKAMETLIHYCKKTECENCMFVHIEIECGIHNPTAWKGVNNE